VTHFLHFLLEFAHFSLAFIFELLYLLFELLEVLHDLLFDHAVEEYAYFFLGGEAHVLYLLR